MGCGGGEEGCGGGGGEACWVLGGGSVVFVVVVFVGVGVRHDGGMVHRLNRIEWIYRAQTFFCFVGSSAKSLCNNNHDAFF